MFRPILAEGAIRPANTGVPGAPPAPARCDSGCDRGALTESRDRAANSDCFGPSNERFEAGYSDTGCDGSGLSSRRMHDDVKATARWLGKVIDGWLNYYAVPTSFRYLRRFVLRLQHLWLRMLRRRSQKDRTGWARVAKLTTNRMP